MTDPHRVLDLASCRMVLILNGAAGRKDTQAREAGIRDRLAPRAKAFSTVFVGDGRGIAGAARQAVTDGADVVVALGGDGTQAAVAGALAGGNAVMGVLPGGTFNYFARDLGVGATPEEALETILGGTVRTLDVGEVNGHVFLNNASLGVYPAILDRREAIYRRWGRSRVLAYWSVLLTLRDMRDPMQLSLTLDGATRAVRTPLAFAARSAFQLESLGLEGAEAIRDGQFALYLAKGQRPVDLAKAAFRLAFGKVARGRDFELVMADEITIRTRQAHRTLALDGEKKRVDGPFRFRVRRGALSVLVPAPATDAPGGAPDAA